MKIRQNVATSMMTIGRSVTGALCLAWLATAAMACGPADGMELDGQRAEVEGDDDAAVVVEDEENVGTSADALSTIGFSTFRGGTGSESFAKPAVDAAGNVYVVGSTPVAGKDMDIFLAKYSPSGALIFNKTFGFAGKEEPADIAVDSSGNSYVVAKTSSFGSAQTIVVVKFNAAGTWLFYTRFGGSGDERPYGIAVDGVGNTYVTGYTRSTDFPVSYGAYQAVHRMDADAFVTKLDADGFLWYSTFLGGDGYDQGIDIAVDGYGYAYVVGSTLPASGVAFPTKTGGFQTIPGGSWDTFVTQLTPSGSSLYYSTLLAGNSLDMGMGIAVDASYNAYVTGLSQSTNFPTTPGAFRTSPSAGQNEYDAFVVKLNEPGTSVYYSTFVGSGGAFTQSVAVGGSGKAVVAGTTTLTTFPWTSNAFQKSLGGNFDGYLMELNPSGTAAPYATYLGGTGFDLPLGVAVDSSGNAYVAGTTNSTNFPVYAAAQPTFGGSQDAFLVKIKAP